MNEYSEILSAPPFEPRRYRQKRVPVAVWWALVLVIIGGALALYQVLVPRDETVSLGQKAGSTSDVDVRKAPIQQGPANSAQLPSTVGTSTVTPSITVVGVGDICPVRSNGASLGTPDGLFSGVRSILSSADATFGNLETALSTRGTPQDKTYTFRASPKFAYGLKRAGFDGVSLANNHALDFGRTAFYDTRKVLNDAGVGYAGGGVDKAAAWRPLIIKRGGATIAYLAFSEITPANFAATTARSGTAYTQDISAIKRAVAAANKRADYVIVSMHWGVEKEYYPTSRQVSEGRAIISAGADAVLAHHPHRIQGVEYYKKGIIAYSLGNFVFSAATSGSTDTFMLRIRLTPSGVSAARAIPVTIVNGAPKIASGATAKRLQSVIKKTSAARGTRVTYAGTSLLLKR